MLLYCILAFMTYAQQSNDTVQLAGGYRATSCPTDYTLQNGYCWISNSQYSLQIQNKYMQDYYMKGKKAKEVKAHRLVIQVRTGENKVTGDVFVPNLPLLIWNDGNKSIDAIRYEDGQPVKKQLKPQMPWNVTTNREGRVVVSVIDTNNGIDLPLLKIFAPFMPLDEVTAIQPNTAALASLTSVDPSQLRDFIQKEQNQSVSLNDTQVVSNTLRQMLLPMLHANTQVKDTPSRIRKRSLYDKPDCKVPYQKVSNLINGQRVHRMDKHQRELHMDSSPEHFEIQFGDTFKYIKHSPRSVQDRRIQVLAKRSFMSKWWQKVKKAAKSVIGVAKDVIVDTPKAFFNITAWKEGKHGFLNSLEYSVSNLTKDSLNATRDVVSLLPFGDRFNEDVGINDLVDKVSNSTGIIVTPLTIGFDLVILGPKQAWHLLVKEVSTIAHVIAGIVKKLGIFLKDVFKFILSLFYWKDILLNHKILVSHYQKMPLFIKTTITEHQGNFSTDLNQVIGRVGDTAVQASSLFASGQFSSFSTLVSSSNKEIYKNLTDSQAVSQAQVSGGPADIQGSYVSDHLASGNTVQNMQLNPTDEQKATLVDVSKNIFTNLGDLVTETDASNVAEQFKSLGNLLKQGHWNITELFSTVGKVFQSTLSLVLSKAVDIVLYYYDVILSLIDGLLKTRINLPFLTMFYERVVSEGQSTLTLYDVFALTASVPLTVGFKTFHNGANIFTSQEAAVIMASASPDEYVDNLIQFGMQYPNRNATKLKNMYRLGMSYVLGAGYSAGQLLSAAVGFATDAAGILFFIRMPFQYLSLMCNFPWTWYTDTKVTVGVNVRFIGWMVQFVGFLVGWLASWPQGFTGFGTLQLIMVLLSAVPNLILIIDILIKDLSIVRPGSGQGAEVVGFTQVDVMLKCFARLLMVLPQLFIAVPFFRENLWSYVSLESIVMTGASVHFARLYIDLPIDALYSV